MSVLESYFGQRKPLLLLHRLKAGAFRNCQTVKLRRYLLIGLRSSPDFQEEFYGREVITATREMVELESDDMIRNADKVDVAFLVVGDPLGWVLSLYWQAVVHS